MVPATMVGGTMAEAAEEGTLEMAGGTAAMVEADVGWAAAVAQAQEMAMERLEEEPRVAETAREALATEAAALLEAPEAE